MHGEPASWWTPIEWNRRSEVMIAKVVLVTGAPSGCGWDVKTPDLGTSLISDAHAQAHGMRRQSRDGTSSTDAKKKKKKS